MQVSYEFFNVLFFFSDTLSITDGLSNRLISIQALGFKKKTTNPNHEKCTVLTYHNYVEVF